MRDIKYIIKRILIGVGIALTLMYLKGNLLLGVSAKEMSSNSYPGLSVAINGTDNNYFWDLTDGSWENWGSGVLIGSGAIIKTNGTSTSGFATVRSVLAYSGNQTYHCKIGSTSNNNSTYFNQSFTFECPMVMAQYGLQQLAFVFAQPNNVVDFTMKLQVNGTMTFIKDDPADSSSTAINNQITNDNTNTTNIINNQNDNTQDIIDNQNDNTQQQIESQKVCTQIDKNNVIQTDVALGSNGNPFTTSGYGITDYINVYNSSLKVLSQFNVNACFYNVNKTFISCFKSVDYSIGDSITIPSDAYYLRSSVQMTYNRPTFELCKNGNQAISDGQQQINDTLNNDNVNGATSQAESFFDDFQSDSHGLSGIITAPLRLITSLSSSTCTSLSIPLPFVQTNATLPCMSTIYSTYFPTFLSLYQLITTGLIGYWVLIKIFGHVKGMQDPKDDRIEVLDL